MQHIASSLAQLWHIIVADVLFSSISVASLAACRFYNHLQREKCFAKLSFVDRAAAELLIKRYAPHAWEFHMDSTNVSCQVLCNVRLY
jgi:hypothetical protein